MAAFSTLGLDLRMLSRHLRERALAGLGMSPDECGRFAALVHLKAHDADKLVEQASLMPELEDELHAVAADLGAVTPASIDTGYQAALREQQRVLQRQLDGGGAEPVSRPSLAALAMRVPDTNIVVIPIAPRPRPLGGGDAA